MQWIAWPRGAALGIISLAAALPAHAIPVRPSELLKERPRIVARSVRVLLGSHSRFSVQGENLLLNGSIRLAGTSVFSLRCGREKESGAPFVEFGAGRRALGTLEISAGGGSSLRMNGRGYREKLLVHSKGSHCLVVNSLDLDRYVAGVIGREMSASWPLEALKAQAVASRSYALYQIEANRSRDFDLESTTQDQVYEGAGGEAPSTLMAAEATRGEVLGHGKDPLKAYFHANCGGTTEVPGFVWGGEAKAFRPVACPYHKRDRDRTRWSMRVSLAQLEGALKKISGLLPKGFRRLASLEAGAPNESRRLSDVAVSDGSGNSVLVSANAFRNALGNTRIKSTAFRIERAPTGYTLEGEGNGHGVGMCQVGARAMAEEGRSYEQILQFYYPLAKIRRLL
jgi:stage II sporulation protein D